MNARSLQDIPGVDGDRQPGAERERAVLVGVILPGVPAWVVEDHLDELAALAETAGAEVVARITQPRMKPDPATFIGRGKVSEVASLCKREKAGLVVFDDDLSPPQVRNLENRIPVKVLDRSGLILDIFATRARTRESKVQVELAQLQYYYPRLTHRWGHLRGQQGGIGFRGPGETQLEVDRRAVQRRIGTLKRQLAKIALRRGVRRRGRRDTPTAALVGYTNVGKSTLLNALSGRGDAFVENRLFATLDPKVRRFEPSPGRPVLVIDTVGFIRKLPHHLVASFRSTLEEAREADLIVHIADLSHPQYEEQIRQTEKVLREMEIDDKPTLLVFNKVDLISGAATLEKAREHYPRALFLSAATGLRVWELAQRLESLLYVGTEEVELLLEPGELGLLDKLSEDGVEIEVRGKEWAEGKVRLILAGPHADLVRTLRILGKGTPGE